MSALMFENKVALITGGARGIGRATALKLARAGADVAVVYYNSSDEAAHLVKDIERTTSNSKNKTVLGVSQTI